MVSHFLGFEFISLDLKFISLDFPWILVHLLDFHLALSIQ